MKHLGFLGAFAALVLLFAMAPTAYCTPPDVADEYGLELVFERATNDAYTEGAWDPADGQDPVTRTVQRSVDSVATRIDAAIRVQYGDAVFGESNALLRDLAIEGAYLDLSRKSLAGLDEKGYEDLRRWDSSIKALASGALKPGDPPKLVDRRPDPSTAFRANPRLFGRHG